MEAGSVLRWGKDVEKERTRRIASMKGKGKMWWDRVQGPTQMELPGKGRHKIETKERINYICLLWSGGEKD